MATRIEVSRSHSFLATSSRWSGHSGAPSVGVGSASLSLRLPGFPSRRLIAVGFGAGPRSPIQQLLAKTGKYGAHVKSSSLGSTLSLFPVLGGILVDPLQAARQNGGKWIHSAGRLTGPIIFVRSDSEPLRDRVTGQTTVCDCRTTLVDSI